MATARKKDSQKPSPIAQLLEGMIKEDSAYRYPVPSSVLVLGRNVPIDLVKDFEDDGEFDYHNIKIKVRAGQVPVEEMDTLLHETMHAIDHWLDLEYTERQIRLMATALIGLFQDNPEFAEFITRPLKPTNL